MYKSYLWYTEKGITNNFENYWTNPDLQSRQNFSLYLHLTDVMLFNAKYLSDFKIQTYFDNGEIYGYLKFDWILSRIKKNTSYDLELSFLIGSQIVISAVAESKGPNLLDSKSHGLNHKLLC